MDEKEQNNQKFKAIPVTGSASYEKKQKNNLFFCVIGVYCRIFIVCGNFIYKYT